MCCLSDAIAVAQELLRVLLVVPPDCPVEEVIRSPGHVTHLYAFSASSLVGWLVDSYTVSAANRSYARLTGVADSRRGADLDPRRPTSLSKEASVPSGLPHLASIYDYVHIVSRSDVFACVCVPQTVFLYVCRTRSLMCVALFQGS